MSVKIIFTHYKMFYLAAFAIVQIFNKFDNIIIKIFV